MRIPRIVSPSCRRHEWRQGWPCAFPPPLSVFLVALGIRLLYLMESSRNPTFLSLAVDSHTYDQAARCLLAGRPMPEQFFWQGFFYPVFLAAIYLAPGGSIVGAKLAQVVLGAATCALTCQLGQTVFSKRAGIAAGLIAALYGPSIFYDAELLAAGWSVFWALALILFLLRAKDEKRAALSFLLGAMGALAIVTCAPLAPFFLAACLWLIAGVWRRAKAPRLAIRHGLALTAGFILVAAPVGWQCRRVTGRFAILPSFGGINFYIGNNPHRDDTLLIRPGYRWEQLVHTPLRNGIADLWGQNRYFYRETRRYIVSAPFDFLKGLFVKAFQFLNSREIPRNTDIYLFREWSVLLRALVWRIGGFGFPFGVLLPLALLGVAFNWRRIPMPFLLFLIFYPAAIVLVFVASRYRLPVVPPLAVLAVGGMKAVAELIWTRRWRAVAAAAAALIALGVVFSLPSRFRIEDESVFRIEMLRAEGVALAAKGQVGAAESILRDALRMNPDDCETRLQLGTVLGIESKHDEAAAQITEALRLAPDYATAHWALGAVFERMNHGKQAVAQYQEALRCDPNMAGAYLRLGMLLAHEGNRGGAITNLRAALAAARATGDWQSEQQAQRRLSEMGLGTE